MVEEGVEKFQFIEYRPTNAITHGAPIDFTIPGSGPTYIYWQRSRMMVKAQIVDKDGTPKTSTDVVAPINLTLHSLFRQVDVIAEGINLNAEIGVN